MKSAQTSCDIVWHNLCCQGYSVSPLCNNHQHAHLLEYLIVDSREDGGLSNKALITKNIPGPMRALTAGHLYIVIFSPI